MFVETGYGDFSNTFESYKITLDNLMEADFKEADSKSLPRDSYFVQKGTYERFKNIFGLDNLTTFVQNHDSVMLKREPILKRHVQEYMDAIKGWSNRNKKLESAHYLKVLAKDTLTNEVSKKITQVPKNSKIIKLIDDDSEDGGYCSEKKISMLMQNYPDIFLPPFSRTSRFGEKLYLDDIELLGISNVTGLYNPRTVKNEEVPLEVLMYVAFSRIKNSKRELEKFVLDLLGRRAIKHGSGGPKSSPYDDIALTMVLPTAQEMYRFKEYLTRRADMTKGFFQNVLTAKQNENPKTKFKKLQDTYNQENYDYIEGLCKQSLLQAKLEAYKKGLPSGQLIITDELYKTVYQNIQGKLMIDGVKEEIFLMTPFLYGIYDNELGHDTSFVDRRTKEHIDLIKGIDKHGNRVNTDVTHLYGLFMEGVFKNLCVMSDYS